MSRLNRHIGVAIAEINFLSKPDGKGGFRIHEIKRCLVFNPQMMARFKIRKRALGGGVNDVHP